VPISITQATGQFQVGTATAMIMWLPDQTHHWRTLELDTLMNNCSINLAAKEGADSDPSGMLRRQLAGC
jgi:hypothetical protein